MSHRSATASKQNPLRVLPSALAMPDIQPRILRVLRGSSARDGDLLTALQLDPLAVVRGLRAMHAPAFRGARSVPSVRAMVAHLGPTLCWRLLAVPTVDVPEASPLRGLWRHAVATAMAAQDMANHTGLLDPEAAYLAGLLCDLPQWVQQLRPTAGSPNPSAADWITYWQLPMSLVQLILGSREPSLHETLTPTDTSGLLRASKRLAALAGFPSPTSSAHEPDDDLAKVDLEAVNRLRRRFETAMAAFGLDERGIRAQAPEVAIDPRLQGGHTGRIDEALLSIHDCTGSQCYRGIVTALTSTTLRHGGYDRVFFGRWHDASSRLILRCKADSSSRKLTQPRLQATPTEAAALREALATGRPVRLEASLRSQAGLLGGLSTDELLAVPINPTFAMPAFLLLDRELSTQPIDLERDLAMATLLGKTGSLLVQNLLLTRRRQRAQKFALTDPLTRLYNRRMGLMALDQEVARAERSAQPLTVLMCDLDHFKQLNDTLGHLQGDNALRATAEVLRLTMRKVDTICRYGGEEFLLVLPNTAAAEATVLAARLFTAVHQRGEELGLPVTVSIGLTSYRSGDTSETMLQRADHALFASKGYGRNRFSADVDPADEPVAPRTP
ncbi:MAG: diguanylate cyclase [Planctomycetes bacterium]|nr:diguanylate cyclase [Planctomycetota bacterium]